MRKQIKLALMVATLAFAPSVQAELCFQNQTVLEVRQGHVEGSMGADSGNALYFRLGNGALYPVNWLLNLNDQVGHSHHRLLLLAMIGGYKVTGYDHSGVRCDDIDELWITG